jgi:isopentenyldiphosphate isomerase
MQGSIAVVDAHNRFLRWEHKTIIHQQKLLHRSVHVMVFDQAGRVVIQRRHASKATYPSYWDCSASGHVEAPDYPRGPDLDLEEVYRSTAQRELQEELGVSAELHDLGHSGPEDGHYEQARLFWARAEGPYRIQPEELEEVRAVGKAEFAQIVAAQEPITPMLQSLLARCRDLWTAP